MFTHLLPLSVKELTAGDLLPESANHAIINGFYPRLYHNNIEPGFFYPSYSQTYLERDISGLINVQNINRFRKFMELLAGRIGQLINFSALSIEVGDDHKTIQSWCSLLEAGFLIYFLRPFHKNYAKRIVKSPKVYFYDTGLASHLLGIRSPEDVAKHWARGALFENMVIADFIKDFYNKGLLPPVYFWRDNKGLEIDLIIEESNVLKAVEIKSGSTLNSSFFTNLDRFEKLADQPLSKYLIYNGESMSVRRNTNVLPWNEVATLL